MKFAALIAAALACLLAGCASYRSQLEPEQTFAKYRRFWVKSNLNDNHAIDQLLVRALRRHGVEADCGPLTMMPETAQAVVMFRDYWAWDFKNHMVGLELTLRDVRTEKPLAQANYSGPAALLTSHAEAVDRLVADLLTPPKPKRKKTG